MEDNPNQNSQLDNALQESPLFQLGLSDLLGVTFVGCVFLAFLVPVFNAETQSMRICLAWIIVALLLVSFLSAAWFAKRRWSCRKRAGALLVKPGVQSSFAGSLPAVLIILICSASAITFAVFLAPILNSMLELSKVLPNTFPGGTMFPVFFTTVSLAPLIIGLVFGLAMLKWKVSPVTLEVRKNGLLIGVGKFIPWKRIQGIEWHPRKKGMALSIVVNNGKHVAFVSHESKDEVESILVDSSMWSSL